MTRILSELLQAPEPQFRLQLRQLERAAGHQNTDIKLSVEVLHAAQAKLKQLGLDAHDTTAEELYQALLTRVSQDDRRLERALRTRAATHVSAEADLMAGMVHALEAHSSGQQVFAIKTVVLKKLIKKHPPKHLVKSLQYRSLDAMLRKESPVALIGAALAVETSAWRRTWYDGYKQLKPADFGLSRPAVLCPQGERWQTLATNLVAEHAHTVMGLAELGTVVVFPLPDVRPEGMVIATMVLALHELNTVAATSNYLKASQVQGDFATRVQAAARGRVELTTTDVGQALPWHMVQQYFARTKAVIQEDVFGPYAQAADFYWHDAEQFLSELCPSLAFWEGSSYLSFLHDGRTVSLNLLDAAISACNQLAYEARSLVHAQEHLWSELMLRYLNPEHLEQAIAELLQPQLAPQLASNG